MDIINPHEQVRIKHGDSVRLHFEISLENGQVVDSTFDKDAPWLVIGDGTLPDGFERVLFNLTRGDTRTAHLSPTEAFGEWQSHNVQHFFKSQFADEIAVGSVVEFLDKNQNVVVGVVKSINDNNVQVDFNHPLAGQNLRFLVKIEQIIPQGAQSVTLS